MVVPIPEISVGAPIECGAVTLFPLFHEVASRAAYILAQEAMAAGSVSVQEATESGVVSCLRVDNRGDMCVLLVEGEHFRGAKQDRVLARSVLVAPRSCEIIPVVCIEWDRWVYKSREFAAGMFCPPSLRHLLKEGRRACAGRRSGHGRNNFAICRENRANGDRSRAWERLANLSHASDARRGQVDDLRMRIPSMEGAAGVAVCAHGKIINIGVFDKPETMTAVWNRIMGGIALDAVEMPGPARQPSILDVMVRVCGMRELAWRQIEPVGVGEDYVAEDRTGDLVTALVVDGVVVHTSVSAPVGSGDDPTTES